jgi:hypothetical protein
MLGELPQTEMEDESDYERWWFETQRAKWEEEQQQGGGSDE